MKIRLRKSVASSEGVTFRGGPFYIPEAGQVSKSPGSLLKIWHSEHNPGFTKCESLKRGPGNVYVQPAPQVLGSRQPSTSVGPPELNSHLSGTFHRSHLSFSKPPTVALHFICIVLNRVCSVSIYLKTFPCCCSPTIVVSGRPQCM